MRKVAHTKNVAETFLEGSPPVGVDHEEDFGAVGSQRGIPKVKDAIAAKFDTVRAEGIESVDCLNSNLGSNDDICSGYLSSPS